MQRCGEVCVTRSCAILGAASTHQQASIPTDCRSDKHNSKTQLLQQVRDIGIVRPESQIACRHQGMPRRAVAKVQITSGTRLVYERATLEDAEARAALGPENSQPAFEMS